MTEQKQEIPIIRKTFVSDDETNLILEKLSKRVKTSESSYIRGLILKEWRVLKDEFN